MLLQLTSTGKGQMEPNALSQRSVPQAILEMASMGRARWRVKAP